MRVKFDGLLMNSLITTGRIPVVYRWRNPLGLEKLSEDIPSSFLFGL